MGAILDRGSLLFASAAVLAATLLLKFTAPGLPISFFTPLLVLAVVYVPEFSCSPPCSAAWAAWASSSSATIRRC